MVEQSSARIQSLRFKSVRLLQLIIESGSVRKAAASLHITQPAASAMLHEVEQMLGLTLFERTPTGMLPTPALHALLHRVTAIGNEVQALAHEAFVMQQRSRQVLRIGVLPRSMQNVMPGVLSQLVQRYRNLEFLLTEATSDVLLRGLANADFDVVISRLTREFAGSQQPVGRSFEIRELYQDGMCVVAGSTHPLAQRPALSLSDTLQWDWVLPPPGSVTRNLLIDEFVRLGLIPPSPVIQSANFLSNLCLVEQGSLLTVSLLTAARKYSQLQNVRILDLKLSVPMYPISMIWRASSPLDGALRLLHDQLVQSLSDDADPGS